MQREILSQQIQIHSTVRIALQKKATTVAALGHMVRYSNGYHSGQASHNSNSSKDMLNEVIFRFSSCLLIYLSPKHIRVNFPVRPRVSPSVPGFPVSGFPPLEEFMASAWLVELGLKSMSSQMFFGGLQLLAMIALASGERSSIESPLRGPVPTSTSLRTSQDAASQCSGQPCRR